MKIYSNGKDRVLTGNFPARFELLQDGVSVPFLRTSKGSIRITGAIPEGELEIQELAPLQRKKKEESKNILDSMYLSIISEADFDRMEETQGEIQKVQDALSKQAKIVEKGTKEVLENENRNAIDINQTNLNMAEMAKAFGKEIQADRDALNATSSGIKQVISETAEVLDAKLQAHEVAKNPHKITKGTVGLGSVDNTSDLDKPVSRATQEALDKKADRSDIDDVRKEIKATEKKQERLVKSIDNANLYGGVGGNELPTGGKKGEVLTKKTNKDGDYEWSSNAGGVTVHNDLTGRDSADCHPISSITGLQSALNDKQDELTAGAGIDITNNTISNTGVRGVKVNGTELTPDADKKVDVTVPTNTNELINGSGYITNSALSNYVTLNTLQTLSSGKKIFANDAVMAGNQTALLATISNKNTATSDNAWVGRYICGAKNLTFLLGTYRTMAGIGVHTWTNAQTGAGAGWGDFYLNPDGQNTVYIGGNWWTKNSGWLKVKNTGNTGGIIQVNKGSISSASWKDVAYKGEKVTDFDFTIISGYDSSKTQTLKHINGTLAWVDD